MICSVAGRRCCGVASAASSRDITHRMMIRLASSSSSSPFAQFASSMLPESVKDAIKSSVLEEVVRSDSRAWSSPNGENNFDSSQQQGLQQQNIANGSSNAAINGSSSAVNGVSQHGVQTSISVNDAISPDRFEMLEDPLDEWFLDRMPHRKLHELPAGVQPLSPETDPFHLSKADMDALSEGIRRDLIGSDHAVLTQAASYFFESDAGGKKVRPMMVLLLSRALSLQAKPQQHQRQDLAQAQRRLAEISEMMHTASLFHDDVIDNSDTRRAKPAVHKVFGNKMAILAGDYLLARASIYLARLRNVEVVETMSTIIEHLVRGEVMQLKGTGPTSNDPETLIQMRMTYYLRKNFYKTASLMANSCKSAAMLGNYPDETVSAAYLYGKHVGMAFQLVDDVLDFEGSLASLGKPALGDLRAGLATAPVLFAAAQYPSELQPLLDRKFREPGDVEAAVALVERSDGMERTKRLAHVHAELAIDALVGSIKDSPYRDSLVHLAYKVVDRTK
jgi:solanesyl diphosphate synthase